jgi:hypothetical protein
MTSIWTFGDSFTDLFENQFKTDIRWSMDYRDYCKGIPPKNFAQIVADRMGMNLRPCGQGGTSNYTIFYSFIQQIEKFKSGDIAIVGWTVTNRYLVANPSNTFNEVLNPDLHAVPHPDVSRAATIELALNRSNYTIWYSELLYFMKIMKMARPDVKFFFWTWADPIEDDYKDMWGNRMNGSILIGRDWQFSSESFKRSIKESADYVYKASEIRTEEDIDNLKKLKAQNKIVFIIENPKEGIIPKLYDIGAYPYYAGSHAKKFYDELIEFKKYTTIEQETKGVVKDLHYSEMGHKEFAEDLILEIEKSYKKNKRNLI